jgi:HAD superfamily hydrolase (TIGR01549 family)
MGSDQLVAALAGEEAEDKLGDDIRSAEKALYLALIAEVEPMADARELIVDLKDRGHAVVLASSAQKREVDHYLDLMDARDLADGWTTSDDVEATKPRPDLVEAAREKAGGGDAVMVGDTPWDVKAAAAEVETIAVLTGGFAESELTEAGACAVFESIEEPRQRLGETPLGT